MLARQNRIRFAHNKLKHDSIVILNFNISLFVIKPSSYFNVIGTKIDTKNSQSKSRPGTQCKLDVHKLVRTHHAGLQAHVMLSNAPR